MTLVQPIFYCYRWRDINNWFVMKDISSVFQNSVLVENRLNINFNGIDVKKVMCTNVDHIEA